jgi:transposase
MATGRRVPGPTRTPARPAPCRRTPRSLHGGLRLRLAAGAFGGSKTGPSPVDRRKLGSKHPLITDANGTPLACLLTSANAHDATQLLQLVEAIPPIRGTGGRPRRRPSLLLADRGYDSKAHRQALRARGIRPVIARRKTAHGSGPRQRPLGRRTNTLLATATPPLAHPLRADGRNTRSLPQPRLLPHLPPDTVKAILLGALRSTRRSGTRTRGHSARRRPSGRRRAQARGGRDRPPAQLRAGRRPLS